MRSEKGISCLASHTDQPKERCRVLPGEKSQPSRAGVQSLLWFAKGGHDQGE